MKVSILTLEYPPNVYGGVGTHIENLVRNLSKFVEIEVRTVRAGINKPEVREYEPWNLFDGKYPRDKAFKTLSLNLAMVRDEIDADIIHTHTWYTNFAGSLGKKMYGKKLISTVHSLEPLRPWKRAALQEGYDLSIWMEEIGLKSSDKIIAVSRGMKEDIMRVYSIPEERIEVIHNGIDIEKFRKKRNEEFIRNLGLEDGYVLFVGRLTKQKGIDTLIEASGEIKAKIVLVTGKEDSKETYNYYREKIAGKENIVWLHRYFTLEQLVHLYTHASVFVSPSIYEPFGITNLEAMACKVPVVGSNVGGIKEIIRDRVDGFLIPPRDPKTLTRRVNLLLKNNALRNEMGKRARERAKEFSWGKVAQKTYELYRGVLEDGDI